MQEKLDKSCNSTKSLKDIEVLEIDELCTYIKKDQRIGSGSTPLYGLLLIEERVKLLILKGR
ncbi:hypothetical protein [Candidatus Midichloria mitochondrii]|uniref:hypothetical protein n=1 Tax=Candidatus Midichloria mitochondrii TaxID=234827 RepID=UPI00178C25C3|nr:hypothetical protein [Candidatus Midichloria mitochondrii]MDJ1299586.1 hypothetical protein [Candidatus Midichloria mitochondrii]